MRAKSIVAIVALVLSSMGSIHGSVVQAFCSDTGERGFAWSAQLACVAVDCHVELPTTETCADDECCAIDDSPAQPLAPLSAPPSLGETATVTHDCLHAESPAKGNEALLRHLCRGGSPPGPDSAAFPGYPLPLLI